MAGEAEQSKDFHLLLADLREEHQPDGPTEDILVFKMAQSFFSATRAQTLLTRQLDVNQAEDNSKQVALMLRYHTTSDRAFNKNLQDLRKLQKERRKEEIGSVSQKTPEGPETQPKTGTVAAMIADQRPVFATEAARTLFATVAATLQSRQKAA